MAYKLRLLVRIAALMFALAVALLSCSPRPGPSEGSLTYRGPVELSTEPGEYVAGTDILYVGASEGRAEFQIEGQPARKKIGDSLDWHGEAVDGVDLKLNLRVLLITEQSVHTGGTVAIEVRNASPRSMPVDTGSANKFTVAVTYAVEKGERIPGSLLSYEGKDEERGAVLGGVEGYPYRKAGDSIDWEGRLRDNVWLRLNLRVLFFNDKTLRVGGLATIWLER